MSLKFPRVRSWAAAGATAAMLIGITLPGAASAAPGDPGFSDRPDQCFTISSDGSVNAPGPGDCAQFGPQGQGRTNAKAKNVILIIGDGMGQSEITAARNYLKGAGGRFDGIDALTSEGLYTHHSINRDGTINYVTDSAASGTAWASGTKTYNGAVDVDLNGNPTENLIEKAKNAGMRTGNVSTAEIEDATPAVMGSHALARGCFGPEIAKNESCSSDELKAQYRENGGLGSIAEQIVDTRADVTLGGGLDSFNETVQVDGKFDGPFLPGTATWTKGTTVLDNAKANGFQVATTADELAAIKSADQDAPVLGLFADGNMTTTFAPSQATIGGGTADPITCKPQDIGTEPELKDMTQKAIDLLDDPESDKGFFLQVESASIDKRDHGADACGQIGETQRLDEATKAALDFAKKDGNTLVVVTADHSHTSQIVEDGNDSVAPITRLLTKDGSTMSLAYGTAPVDGGVPAGSEQHTGAQLRVAAFGPGEQNVLGQTDQTDLFFTISNALGLNPDAGNGNSDGDLKAPNAPQDVNQTCYLVDPKGGVTAPGPGACSQYGPDGQGRSDAKAKNVVLFIGDGMGDSEITSARNYLYGASGRLPGIDNLDYTGSYTHFSLNPETGKPDYVTDSAASGTEWATGVKTYNGAIGVDIKGQPHENLIEKAKAAGLKTGNVSTAEIEDATPAVMGAHALGRKCYGPEIDKNSSCSGDEFQSQYRENGGLGSIAEQIVDTRADITLGGGLDAFNQLVQVDGKWADTTTWTKGTSVLDNAKANGFQIATTAEELAAIKSADQDAPVLGLFADGNMPRKFAQSIPTADGATGAAQTCKPNPERTADVPTLKAMTQTALNVLQNDKGFFLQVEGASVDKADHDADACGQIGELDDLDQAVAATQQWVAQTGEPTLIIVTADHSHTSQITEDGEPTAGLTTKLRTADNSDMVLNYATAASNDEEEALGGQGHTGAQLRIAASGPSAENVIGRTDQSDVFYTIGNALNLPKESAPVENLFKATDNSQGGQNGQQDNQKGNQANGSDKSGQNAGNNADKSGQNAGNSTDNNAGNKASNSPLPRTGVQIAGTLTLAAVLLVAGGFLVVWMRKRKA